MKKMFRTVGMILGIVVVVLGLYLAFGFGESYHGSSTYSYSFGADYYTEQYQATENAADNILALGEYIDSLVSFGLKVTGLIIAAFGGIITCYFGCKKTDAQITYDSNMKTNNMGPQKAAALETKTTEETKTAEEIKAPEETTTVEEIKAPEETTTAEEVKTPEETKTQTAESGETSGDDNAELPEI